MTTHEGDHYVIHISRETEDDGPAAEILDAITGDHIATRYGREAQRLKDALNAELDAYGDHYSEEALAEGIDRIAHQATNAPADVPADAVRDLLAAVDRSFTDLAARFIWYRDTEAGAAIRSMRRRIAGAPAVYCDSCGRIEDPAVGYCGNCTDATPDERNAQ